jgi:hypothetical protein
MQIFCIIIIFLLNRNFNKYQHINKILISYTELGGSLMPLQVQVH